MWVGGQTTIRCCIFNKIQHVFIEQGLIIRDANGGTEPGAQRSQWVQLSHFIRCVLPQPCARMGLILAMQRSKTRLALERLTGWGGMLSSLLKAMVCGEDSLCYSNLDPALILLTSSYKEVAQGQKGC